MRRNKRAPIVFYDQIISSDILIIHAESGPCFFFFFLPEEGGVAGGGEGYTNKTHTSPTARGDLYGLIG